MFLVLNLSIRHEKNRVDLACNILDLNIEMEMEMDGVEMENGNGKSEMITTNKNGKWFWNGGFEMDLGFGVEWE